MTVTNKHKNCKRQRGAGIVGALIFTAIFIAIVILVLFWPRDGDSPDSNGANVTASITVGADFNKPGLSKIGYICPGETVGLAWGTGNANNATIEPELGEVALEGFASVSPISSTNYVITALGDAGSASDFAAISVITPNNNTITKTFSAPQVDPDTGYPANLIWQEILTPSFISRNIFVTGIQLIQTPSDWPYWDFRKSDPSGTIYPISTRFGETTEFSQPFVAVGHWEGTPVNLDHPIVTAKGRLEIRLKVKCKQ